ncbi:MAG: NAD-dependent epimerase/dehydratase family protein [Lachnospiraceae bacterium]|jgi:UDP-glucose 4-epimerase|nr:NAD-dependent epimerase/dehydratase family protein [Lachnospiraceae bacterium]
MPNDFYSLFENTKVLVVGGAGFVGSNLSRLLTENVNKISVHIVDNLLSSEIINLPKNSNITFYEGSITDFRILSNLSDEYDYIFHLATYHGNQSSIFDPIKDHENNTLTTLKLFERLKGFRNLKKIVYSSAGCSVAKKTFDTAMATTEESPIELKQDSPYSISKIIGEFYSVYYHKQYHLPTVRARFQNVYGPGEVLGAGNWRGTYATIWRNVTPTFIYKALTGQEIPLENEGVASRDFIFVEDICRGLMLCALKGEPGDVYNIGSGVETTIAELAEKIKDLSGSKSKIQYLPKRDWDNSGKRFASTVKSREILGFEAIVPISEGLKVTINWTKENIKLIERNINKHMDHLNYYN